MYTTNVEEAREIVDQDMMERIIIFQKQIQRDVRLSVVKGVMYVAISINEELLEPSISNPDNKEHIKDYFFSVLLILSIINQLDIPKFM